ncbi:MAG: DUF2851 family protein [Candidatus Limimorpha sp.]
MREEFLYYLWENKLLYNDLFTTEGEVVEIVSVGVRNRNSGPDYCDAKIKVGETLWVGNVEMHVNSSDWYVHGHQYDSAYDSVILHVVYRDDKKVVDIPTVEVAGKFDASVLDRYGSFVKSKKAVPCCNMIRFLQQFTWLSWLERMSVERLEYEVGGVEKTFKANNNDWEETLYQRVMRYFGLKVNNDAFEWLAKILPLRIIRKHTDDKTKVEALLYGSAGFLSESFSDDYPNMLQREYKVLKSKYGLVTMPMSYWKFLRLRPPNFPSIRLSQVASVLCGESLFSRFVNCEDLSQVRSFFDVGANDYWSGHYMFDKVSGRRSERRVGLATIDVVVMNAVIPVMYLYGMHHERQEIKDRCFRFLEEMEGEDNNIVRIFRKNGVVIGCARHSQALIHLYREYCLRRRCLECRVFGVLKLL